MIANLLYHLPNNFNHVHLFQQKESSFQSTFSYFNESSDHARFILQVNFFVMIICPTYQAIQCPVVMEIRTSFKVTAVTAVILS